ncbi:hypothetical protein [uncultured Gammaproteobacteria bacterium]|nr:hypothetical protein [uncultured Gammaproteobacteria bacterium]CAC9541939.1 hypothetical protein [uncultured Gammaproteobacteria bacterium]CAC9551853.1 hypothetical protein [uncultured Gammaproteobacteria bacterium]CAC9571511.1 hypothetical protein [uncultured Gammaproteobacteria bacterium]CAC9962304.1 hypothetical protein [uncultured Gammaproteobacteria bacterium]
MFAVDEVGITWRLLLVFYCQSIVSMPVEIFGLVYYTGMVSKAILWVIKMALSSLILRR